MNQYGTTFWENIGYSGSCGPDGLPDPGQLLRQHRKKNHLTQTELARKLQMNRSVVSLMESQNHGMDSMTTRRKILTALPTIPAMALGLSIPGEKIQPRYDTSLLRQLLHYHREAYFNGSDTGSIAQIERTIKMIYELSNNDNHANKGLLEVLCMYNQLALDIAREKRDYYVGKQFASNSYQIANALKDDELKASSLLRWSAVLFEEGNIGEAIAKIDEALHIKKLPDFLRAGIAIHAVYPYASIDASKSLYHAKYSVALSGTQPDEEERHYIRLTHSFAQIRQAFAYNKIGKPDIALDILKSAEAEIGTAFPRRLVGLKVVKAHSYLLQRDPEQSASIAMSALSLAYTIQSLPNVALVNDLHQQLLATTPGNREIIKLGRLLSPSSSL